jgi:uncharacterized membrane protein
MSSLLDSLSPTTLAIIAVVALVQICFQIWSLIDLSRRESVYGGRKWVWAVVIICAGFLGAFIYLGLGRVVYESSGEDEQVASERATRRALDNLYGDKK